MLSRNGAAELHALFTYPEAVVPEENPEGQGSQPVAAVGAGREREEAAAAP